MEILTAVIIVSAIGLIAGVILTVASKIFAVPSNELQEKVREALPGANCGACGYSGCDGYAAAVASGEAKPDLCTVGGEKTAKEIGEALGIEVIAKEKNIAVVRCSGTNSACGKRFEYVGVKSCSAANLLHGGDTLCEFGCLGYGDCMNACEYGAVSVVDGLARINPELCTGCTKCSQRCPRSLIMMRPYSKSHTVGCQSKLKGAVQRKICTAGCIGCGKCTKVCPTEAISLKENLARIDTAKCTDCGACKEACPTHCII